MLYRILFAWHLIFGSINAPQLPSADHIGVLRVSGNDISKTLRSRVRTMEPAVCGSSSSTDREDVIRRDLFAQYKAKRLLSSVRHCTNSIFSTTSHRYSYNTYIPKVMAIHQDFPAMMICLISFGTYSIRPNRTSIITSHMHDAPSPSETKLLQRESVSLPHHDRGRKKTSFYG